MWTTSATSRWRRYSQPIVCAFAVVAALSARYVIASGNGLAFEATVQQWALGASVLFITVGVVVLTGFYRRWAFWQVPPKEPVWVSITGTLLALVVLTMTFAIATVLLASIGVLQISGWNFISRTEVESASEAGFGTSTWITGDEILGSVELYYVWHLLDTVPQLKIPDTLNWELEHEVTDLIGGVLLLSFKVLVVLPVITLAVGLIRSGRKRGEDNTAPSNAHSTDG